MRMGPPYLITAIFPYVRSIIHPPSFIGVLCEVSQDKRVYQGKEQSEGARGGTWGISAMGSEPISILVLLSKYLSALEHNTHVF